VFHFCSSPISAPLFPPGLCGSFCLLGREVISPPAFMEQFARYNLFTGKFSPSVFSPNPLPNPQKYFLFLVTKFHFHTSPSPFRIHCHPLPPLSAPSSLAYNGTFLPPSPLACPVVCPNHQITLPWGRAVPPGLFSLVGGLFPREGFCGPPPLSFFAFATSVFFLLSAKKKTFIVCRGPGLFTCILLFSFGFRSPLLCLLP